MTDIADKIIEQEVATLLYLGSDQSGPIVHNDQISLAAAGNLQHKNLIRFDDADRLSGLSNYSLTEKGLAVYESLLAEGVSFYKKIQK